MKVRPPGAQMPGGGRELKAMPNSSAPNEKRTGTSEEDAAPVREHSEMPAEGGVGHKKPEPRMHSQNAAEGPEDES